MALSVGQDDQNRKPRDGRGSVRQPGSTADEEIGFTSFDRFMQRSEVINTTGLSDTTLWREYRAGRFPKPIQLTKNRVGWLESEVRAWMAARLEWAPPRFRADRK